MKYNIILNIINKILYIMLSVTYVFFSYLYFNESLIKTLLPFIFGVVIFITSIIDIVRFKEYNLKYNILNLILYLLMLLNIYRPYIDSILLNNLANNFLLNLSFSYTIFEQNFILITLFMIITFILNIKFNKINL